MSTRRSFIGALFATPVALAILPEEKSSKVEAKPEAKPKAEWYLHQPTFLPIGCDLSFCALRWALEIAEKKKLGEPKYLLVGPENKFVAREILGDFKKPYTGDSNVNVFWYARFPFEVMYAMPFHTWKMVFERGVVISEGPR